MAVYVDESGRWSGGGAAMIRNFVTARQSYPDLFTTDPRGAKLTLIPRNVPHKNILRARPYLIAPQNVWPWYGPLGGAEEAWLVTRLRIASEIAIRRASGVLRISSVMPDLGPKCFTSPVLNHVLDEDFDIAAKKSTRQRNMEGCILTVGSIHSYRNLDRLVRAYRIYRRNGGKFALVVVGSPGSSSAYRSLIKCCTGQEDISIYTGGMARDDVIAAMKQASGVVLPSLIEVSSFTLLEATALNGGVVASDIRGHNEVLRQVGHVPGSALFDPRSDEAIACALHKLDDGFVLPHHEKLADPGVRAAMRDEWVNQLTSWLSHMLSQLGRN